MDSKDVESKEDFEHILGAIGTTGNINKFMFMVTSSSLFIVSANTFSYGFLGFTPPHWCQNDAIASNDWTMEQRRNLSIPFIDGKFDECNMYDIDYSSIAHLTFSEARLRMDDLLSQNVSQRECLKREFNTTIPTTVTEWDLVCERRVLYSTTQAVTQLGMLIGSAIVGYLTDRFGRKKVIVSCTLLLSFFGFCTIFSPNVWIFILLRLLASGVGMGLCNAGFIYCLELCLPSQRSSTGNLFSLPWAFAVMTLPGVAYLICPWYYLQTALFLPSALLCIAVWFLPESPRWLITNGKFKEAHKVLERISHANRKTLPEENKLMKTMEHIYKMANVDTLEYHRKTTWQYTKETFNQLAYIIVDTKFRTRTLLVFHCWFTVAMVYYGVSLGSPTPNEQSNAYLYMFLGGVLEVIAFTVIWPISEYFGRKKSICGFFTICSVSILSALILITFRENKDFIIFQWILFLMGKFSITAAFQLTWLFTVELYPTNYRSIAVGESSTVARVGSMSSSYINDLLVKILPWAPAALFGSLSASAALCALFLPETVKENLTEIVPKEEKLKGREYFVASEKADIFD